MFVPKFYSMDLFLIILAGIFIIIGIVGSVIPGLPGPPLGYIGLLLLEFTNRIEFNLWFLIGWGIAVIIVLVLDNLLPMWSTRKFGGSKWGVTGSIIGMLVGLILPPVGIILGTLIGAVIGELIYSKKFHIALKAGFGAFIGFMLSVGLKLSLSFVFLYYYVYELIQLI